MAEQNWNPALYQQSHAFVFGYGQGLVELLAPKAGEHILDLGCGTGQLTEQIVQSGAHVIGLDASESMIATARQNYPHLTFLHADATDFTVPEPCDAVFSNAVLHWVTNAEAAARCIAAALKPGGRFVAEFGGHGNISNITDAIQTVLLAKIGRQVSHGWYYPSMGEYATVLESCGLEVQQAWLFDRDTPLAGDAGMRNWLTMFAERMLAGLTETEKEEALTEIEMYLRESNYSNGQWYADYRRIRVVAVRQ
jgi:trans-aconitate 2-methyltransferase